MYNTKDIQFAGKHDFDSEQAKKSSEWGGKSFSVKIFKWELNAKGDRLTKGKGVLRVHADPKYINRVLEACEIFIKHLDNNEWDGRKNAFLKY